MKNIKNLKVYKNIIACLIAGGVSISCANTNDIVSDKKEMNESSTQQEANVTPTPEVTIEPTATPTPTATPVPTPVVVDYPKDTYGYVTRTLKLKSDLELSEITDTKVPVYKVVKMINKTDDKVLVKVGKEKGYIKDKNIQELDERFVNIDIEKQEVRIIDEDGNLVLKTPCVTGNESSAETRSDRGIFEIFAKDEDRYLRGPGYSTHVNYFAPYNGGEGLHDACWRSSFGGDIYKTDGSHGCINLPVDIAPKVYKNVKIGTKVIVHD